MPQKRKAQVSSAPVSSKRNAIVTIDPSMMSKNIVTAATSDVDKIRGESVLCRGSLDECVYHIMLQEEEELILASLSLEVFDSIVSTLKPLLPIASIATNMQNKRATSLIASALASATRVVACGGNVLYFVIRDIKVNPFGAVIHCGPLELQRKCNENVHMFLGSAIRQIHIITSPIEASHFTSSYTLNNALRPLIQSRIAVARKLYKLSVAQAAADRQRHRSEHNSEEKPVIDASARLALQNKLNILLHQSASSPALTVTSESSQKVLREKMSLLGMLVADSLTDHPDADRGRSLALTKWMDNAKGSQFGADFGIIRQGASADKYSFAIRENISAFRSIINEYSKHKPSVSTCQEITLLPQRRIEDLKRCRVIGIGWRPNPAGDEDQWGGCYGKCCAHNEVVMHYLRPFFPMEVINTHLCSQASPAPGNEAYEGCLEFLQAQCRLKRRAVTVWDTTHIHFISKSGYHTAYSKDALLSFPLHYLKFVMQNLRAMTIETRGQVRPDKLLVEIDTYMRLYSAKLHVTSLGNNPSLQKRIASYLLHGSSGMLGRAAKNYVGPSSISWFS